MSDANRPSGRPVGHRASSAAIAIRELDRQRFQNNSVLPYEATIPSACLLSTLDAQSKHTKTVGAVSRKRYYLVKRWMASLAWS